MYCKLSKPISLPQLCMLRQILYYCLAFMFVFLLLFVFYPFSARLDQLPCEPSKPIRVGRVGRCAHSAVLSTATLIKAKMPFYFPANRFLFSCKLIFILLKIDFGPCEPCLQYKQVELSSDQFKHQLDDDDYQTQCWWKGIRVHH